MNISAQNKYLKDANQTQQLSKEITALFFENKISKAFKDLTEYWPLPENEINSLEEKTIKYLNMIQERFGKAIGTSYIRTEKITDFAIRETYIVRYQYSAIRIIFTYYRNDKGWLVNSFKWDDSFVEEFK
jgi:hypothetical protein